MKRKLLFLVILTTTFNLHIYSQYDFKKGFIITNNNDTIQGFIDYTNPRICSQFCYFKNDIEGEVKEYTPETIKEFQIINEKCFISKNINNNITENVFVEYLLKGTVSLYYTKLRNETEMFLMEKNDTIYSLTNNEEECYINNVRYLKKSYQYIDILKLIMFDSKYTMYIINLIEFNHKSLIEIIKEYNETQCKGGSCVVYYKKQKNLNDSKWQFDFGLLVSFDWINIMQNEDEDEYQMTNITASNLYFNSTTSCLTPGVFFSISRNTKFSLQFQLKYQDIKCPQKELKKLQLPVLFTYDFTRYTKLIPYITFGLNNEFYLYSNSSQKPQIEYDKLTNIFTNEYSHNIAYYEFSDIFRAKYTNNFILGFGLKYHLENKKVVKFDIINSYGSHITKSINFPQISTTTTTNSLSAIISYQF